jgi:hypothetical protein
LALLQLVSMRLVLIENVNDVRRHYKRVVCFSQGKQPAALWRAAFPDDPQCLSFWQLMNQESTYTGTLRVQD